MANRLSTTDRRTLYRNGKNIWMEWKKIHKTNARQYPQCSRPPTISDSQTIGWLFKRINSFHKRNSFNRRRIDNSGRQHSFSRNLRKTERNCGNKHCSGIFSPTINRYPPFPIPAHSDSYLKVKKNSLYLQECCRYLKLPYGEKSRNMFRVLY